MGRVAEAHTLHAGLELAVVHSEATGTVRHQNSRASDLVAAELSRLGLDSASKIPVITGFVLSIVEIPLAAVAKVAIEPRFNSRVQPLPIWIII